MTPLLLSSVSSHLVHSQPVSAHSGSYPYLGGEGEEREGGEGEIKRREEGREEG